MPPKKKREKNALTIGGNVGHEGIHNPVAIIFHQALKLIQHGLGDIVLGFERLIQFHAGDGGPDNVEDVSLDLKRRNRETIPRVVGRFGHHLVLHRNPHLDEYVILGFGLAYDVKLLHAEGEPARHGLKRPTDEMCS